jgi:hypothetical protein
MCDVRDGDPRQPAQKLAFDSANEKIALAYVSCQG